MAARPGGHPFLRVKPLPGGLELMLHIGVDTVNLKGEGFTVKVEPGAIFGGNLERHRETVEAITTGYGSRLPDMQVAAGFNEFDHNEVVNRFRPEWADRAIFDGW